MCVYVWVCVCVCVFVCVREREKNSKRDKLYIQFSILLYSYIGEK